MRGPFRDSGDSPLFELYHAHAARAKDDILSGLTVALALVPEAVAFAFVAGVNPLVGLYAAFMVGLITSLVGGRPGMISGATGALVIDAISGTGLTQPPGEPFAEISAAVQRSALPVLAIDLPSGLDCDSGAALYALEPRRRDLETVFAEVNGGAAHAA